MNFEKAKVGERYHIWVLAQNLSPVYNYSVDHTGDPDCCKLACRVIGILPGDDGEVIVGWKSGEPACSNTFDRPTVLDTYAPVLLPGYDLFDCVRFRACSIQRWAELIGDSQERIVYSGASCAKCKDFNHYGAPNMDDGSFVCYTCRKRKL
jgi:hypothetical protein